MGNKSEPSGLEGNEEMMKLEVSDVLYNDSSSSVSSDSAASQGSRISHDFLANIGNSYVPSSNVSIYLYLPCYYLSLPSSLTA